MEEALDASLLLHVIDASDPGFQRQLEVTDVVLAEIEADDVPRLRVFNKIDHVGDEVEQAACTALLHEQHPGCIVMSAKSATDVARLHAAIMAFFQKDLAEAELLVPWSMQQLRGEIFSGCQVLEEKAEAEGALFRVRAEPAVIAGLREQLDPSTAPVPAREHWES